MDSRITTLPSLILVLPCNVDSAKLVSASDFVLHHFCCYFIAFCSATVPIKGLFLANESVRNSSSIDGTRPNMGFFALSSQHHTSTYVNTIARFLSGILLLCLLRTFTVFFKGYFAICLRATWTDFMFDNNHVYNWMQCLTLFYMPSWSIVISSLNRNIVFNILNSFNLVLPGNCKNLSFCYL